MIFGMSMTCVFVMNANMFALAEYYSILVSFMILNAGLRYNRKSLNVMRHEHNVNNAIWLEVKEIIFPAIRLWRNSYFGILVLGYSSAGKNETKNKNKTKKKNSSAGVMYGNL